MRGIRKAAEKLYRLRDARPDTDVFLMTETKHGEGQNKFGLAEYASVLTPGNEKVALGCGGVVARDCLAVKKN